MRPTQLLKPLCIVAILATLCWIAAPRDDQGRFTALAALSVIAWGGAFHASGRFDQHIRRRALLAALSRRGLRPDTSLSGDLQHRAGELHYIPDPRDTDLRLRLFAEGAVEGRPARVAEYSLRMRSGNSNLTLTYVEAAIACPAEWPRFQVSKPVFRPIRIDAPDPSAAAAFLTPALRAWLALNADGDTWTVKDGFLSITRPRACSPRDAERMFARLAELESRVSACAHTPRAAA